MGKREFFIFAGILFILLGAYRYFKINGPEWRAIQEAARLTEEQKKQESAERERQRQERNVTRVDVVVASGRWQKYGVELYSNHWVRIDFEGKIELRGSARGDRTTYSVQLDSRKSIWQELPVRWIWVKSLESRNVNVTILQCPRDVCRKEQFFDGAALFGMTTL
jgi:hypothetical protein